MTTPSHPAPSADRALHILEADLQILRRGLALGNRAVVETIESECVRVQLNEPGTWFDTRPMLDPREHSPRIIDEAAEALSYAETVGLVRRHAVQRYLVCVINPTEQAGR